ncbi:MAG: DNA-binding transcriptional regulator [Planctomycetota bacterium]
MPRVALIIPWFGRYSRLILQGITRYTHLNGPWQFYSDSAGTVPVISQADIESWRADGIIAAVKSRQESQILINSKLPVIFVTSRRLVANMPSLTGDWQGTGKMAAEYLLGRGFKNFAFCGYSDVLWSRERGKYYCECISRAGFEAQTFYRSVRKVHRSWDLEQQLLVKWLKKLPRPVAIFACNDERGRHVIDACRTAGLSVPEDAAVLGADDDTLVCEMANPPLSSICFNCEKAGYEAAGLLDRLMAGTEAMANQRVKIEPLYVVMRQSTDVLAIDEEEVAKAVRFIREHSARPIQVSDVVGATTLSRSGLYKRFNNVLGCSINKEISRSRANRIIQLLLETNMSITAIAAELGFSDPADMARFFHKETGFRPRAYRDKFGLK